MFCFNTKKRVFLGLFLAGLALLAVGFAVRSQTVTEAGGRTLTAVSKQEHLGKPGMNGPVAVLS
ncbi:MAG: hypothetical protein KDE56_11230, partial [Anaerolineales bacterium]|nr:hypothetical protein [Anaerolineales bacterium]